MKIKCIKAGNISFGGNVLSVAVGQEFPGDETFSGLTDLYADMFELVQDKEEKVTTPKVKEATPELLVTKAKKLSSK